MVLKNFPIWQLIKSPRATTVELLRRHRYPAVLPFVLIISSFGALNSSLEFIGTGWLNFAKNFCLNFVISLVVVFFQLLAEVELKTHIGKFLGGKGSRKDIRSAWIWGKAPSIIITPFLFILLFLLTYLKRGNFHWLDPSIFNVGMMILYIPLFILILYTVFFPLFILAEAHRFSFLKALLLQVISIIVLVAVVALLVLFMVVFNL